MDKTDIDCKCPCGCNDTLRSHVLLEWVKVMDSGEIYVTRLWEADGCYELTVKWGKDPLYGSVSGSHVERVTKEDAQDMLKLGLEKTVDLASGAV